MLIYLCLDLIYTLSHGSMDQRWSYVWEETILNSVYCYLNRNSERNSEPPFMLHRFIVLCTCCYGCCCYCCCGSYLLLLLLLPLKLVLS